MNLYLRLIWVMLKLIPWNKTPTAPLACYAITLCTFPNDLDPMMHVNNGRYLTFMDLGRFQLIVRLGLWRFIFKNRWIPVIGATKTHFIRSLRAFQKFTLTTQVVYWDDKWVYLEQNIYHKDQLYVTALFKSMFLAKNGPVPSDDVWQTLGVIPIKPNIPDVVQNWIDAEEKRKIIEITPP